MNKSRYVAVFAAFFTLLCLCAGLTAGCGSNGAGLATNVTSGKPLPLYQPKPGDPTPKAARAAAMARRAPGP
jgi:hypothetical protein